MVVVSNTSPVLDLAIVDRLDLLREQFERILVPPAVVAELRLEEALPGNNAIRDAVTAGWIEQAELASDVVAALLRHDLDDGESEAIALAQENQADVLLLDETDARRAARGLGLCVVGVLGVLLRASGGVADEQFWTAIRVPRLRSSCG